MGWVFRYGQGRDRKAVRQCRKKKAHLRRTFGQLLPALALLGVVMLASWAREEGDGLVGAGARRLLSGGGSCNEKTKNEFYGISNTSTEAYNGGLVLNILVVLFMFLGIAIVCDDFFVPALEEISEQLKLSEDVAGATFMAAGSSAPELFTSLMSLIAPSGESELGVGAIVGSAVFNILMIVGLTAVFAGKTLDIDWRPLLRDATFYFMSIMTTLIFFSTGRTKTDDGEVSADVYWWAGLISVLLYCGYVTYMCYNEKIMDYMSAWEQKHFPEGYAKRQANMESKEDSGPVTEALAATQSEKDPLPPPGAQVELPPLRSSSPMSPESEAGSVSTIDAASTAGSAFGGQPVCESKEGDYAVPEKGEKKPKDVENQETGGKEEAEGDDDGDDDDGGSPFDLPEKPQDYPLWALSLPWYVAFTFTVPPCGDEKWKKWYLVSFLTSIAWIALISYLMVESTAKIGCILDIPSIVMGNTILAAGTSIPDALSSIMVAKQGMGDMAVANAVGSNVFDIWLGLGLPWLVYLPFGTDGDGEPLNGKVNIKVGQLTPNILILLGVLVLYFGAIALSGWKLSMNVGKVFICLYGVYTIYLLVFVWHLDIYNEQ